MWIDAYLVNLPRARASQFGGEGWSRTGDTDPRRAPAWRGASCWWYCRWCRAAHVAIEPGSLLKPF